MFKKILFSLLLLAFLAQLLPKNLPDVTEDNPADFIKKNNVPEDVAKILKTSCYDCHSNETEYPWYSYVVPVNYLIVHDINEGREELNFSDWDTLSKRKKLKYAGEISESIESEEMPFPAYLITHRDAVLSEEQKERIINWFDNDYSESLFN